MPLRNFPQRHRKNYEGDKLFIIIFYDYRKLAYDYARSDTD